jgi:hypothetical protein
MASCNVIHNSSITDPKLRQIARRVANSARLAAEKAVAHEADPRTYPLPRGPKCLERVFHGRFCALPRAKFEAAIPTVMRSVQAAPEVRARLYKDLAAVDLQSTTDVRSQVRQLDYPTELRIDPTRLVAMLPSIVPLGSPRVPSAEQSSTLGFKICRVKCLDETNSFWEPEWSGSDEIDLGGNRIDPEGEEHAIDRFRVGDFDDGTVKIYWPAREFTRFDLLVGGEDWPKSFFVILALAEIDMGGFGDFLNDLVNWLREEVSDSLLKAVGTAVGGIVGGGLFGAAVGFLIGAILDELINWLRQWWGDEVFLPVDVATHLESAGDLFAGMSRQSQFVTVSFRGNNGHYTVTGQWCLDDGNVGGTHKSLASFNYPDKFIRHRHFRGQLTDVDPDSDLDQWDATFRIVAGLVGDNTVSFESLNYPGRYFRHRNFQLWLDTRTDDELFRKDATFKQVTGLADPSTFSFESINYPGRYIRHRGFQLFLEKGDDALFRKDASFRVVAPLGAGFPPGGTGASGGGQYRPPTHVR